MSDKVLDELLTPVYRSHRGITQQTMEKFGVQTLVDSDGKSVKEVYPYPSGGKKVRLLPKTFYAENLQADELFGMNLFNAGSSRTITITEGEGDCLSAYQMLSDSQYTNPVVSLPSASPSKRLWEKCKPYLDSFEKIILSVDNDEPGNRVAEQIYRIFPGKVYRVPHSKFKDANEFLMAGAAKDYKSAWFNAQKMKPETVLTTAEDFLKLYDDTPNYEYFKTNIPELDEKILGIHKGQYTVIMAMTGVGKTEVMRYLEYQCYKNTDYTIAICHLEETPLRSMLGLVSYELQDNLTRKDLIDSKNREADVKRVLTEFGKSERIHQFSLQTGESYEDLIDQIKFLVGAMGVDYIFIEPIQDIVIGDVKDKESKLSDLTNLLSRLAPEINVGIVVIAHSNDDGEAKYCRSIIQKAAFEIVLSRDQDAEGDEANRTHVRVGRKNRVGGGSGPAGVLEFNLDTYTLTPESWNV